MSGYGRRGACLNQWYRFWSLDTYCCVTMTWLAASAAMATRCGRAREREKERKRVEKVKREEKWL